MPRVTVDDDGQNPADQALLLVEKAVTGGHDVVFGEFAQHAFDPSSEPFLIGETTLRGDFADPQSIEAALEGVERALLLSGPGPNLVEVEMAKIGEFGNYFPFKAAPGKV